MIISRTPFRISFFGGGTDYPAWFEKHGGSVIATTIDKYCYISLRYLPPFFEHKYRIIYSKIENCLTIDEIAHPAVREVMHFLNVDRGVEIHHDADLPARSGMGSSSSFTVGLLHALYALQGRMVSKYQLAKESIYIEQECLKETVGSQDQISAAYGGFNCITFLPNNEFTVKRIILRKEILDGLDSHLMLFYTGIKRTASDVASSYVDGIEKKGRQLRIMKDLVDESMTILGKGDDIKSFGALLHETWQLKRSLSDKVSNSYVDELYNEAMAAGAIGGKITGAGGGGFLLLFVPPASQAQLKERFNKLVHVPFKFEFSGSQIIFCDRENEYPEEEKVRGSKPIQGFRELTEI
jgi:D-glycero-alpha-D-manno-heptose-7-phosphate kinase